MSLLRPWVPGFLARLQGTRNLPRQLPAALRSCRATAGHSKGVSTHSCRAGPQCCRPPRLVFLGESCSPPLLLPSALHRSPATAGNTKCDKFFPDMHYYRAGQMPSPPHPPRLVQSAAPASSWFVLQATGGRGQLERHHTLMQKDCTAEFCSLQGANPPFPQRLQCLIA